jgi:metal-sulfur cluster biosynthetic enzyme
MRVPGPLGRLPLTRIKAGTPARPHHGAMNSEHSSHRLEERVRDALSEVIDPEAGLDVVQLGLVYSIEASEQSIRVRMTMTSAACPLGDEIVEEALHAIRRAVPQVHDVDVGLVWDPPWDPSMMSEEARGFFGWSRS